MRPSERKAFKAFGGINNLLNLGYEALSWRIHRAILAAHLEPYLGYVHSLQHGKPSLVCDLQELYRSAIDCFVIDYCKDLNKKDFITKTEAMLRDKKSKREYLSDLKTREMMDRLNNYFVPFIVSNLGILTVTKRKPKPTI